MEGTAGPQAGTGAHSWSCGVASEAGRSWSPGSIAGREVVVSEATEGTRLTT
jgi:hypothetical protein